MREAFGQGKCSLIKMKDPTEIVAFYYVDGLPISSIQDLTGRCLDAFLNRRMHCLNQTESEANGEGNVTQQVGIPIYSGKDAEKRILKEGIFSNLSKVVEFRAYPKT